MPVRDGSIPPLLMFRSFMTIACGVIGQWCIVAFTILAVMSLFFPEYKAAIGDFFSGNRCRELLEWLDGCTAREKSFPNDLFTRISGGDSTGRLPNQPENGRL